MESRVLTWTVFGSKCSRWVSCARCIKSLNGSSNKPRISSACQSRRGATVASAVPACIVDVMLFLQAESCPAVKLRKTSLLRGPGVYVRTDALRYTGPCAGDDYVATGRCQLERNPRVNIWSRIAHTFLPPVCAL